MLTITSRNSISVLNKKNTSINRVEHLNNTKESTSNNEVNLIFSYNPCYFNNINYRNISELSFKSLSCVKPSFLEFVPQSVEYANTLKINPFDELKNPKNRKVLVQYVSEHMFREMPKIGQNTFGEVFYKEFLELAKKYKSIPNPDIDSIYTELREKAVTLSSEDVLEKAAQAKREARAFALGEGIARIFKNSGIKLPKNAQYLDVGCGDCLVTDSVVNNMKFKPENVSGVEIGIRDDNISGYNTLEFDGSNIPANLSKPDLVTLFSVLHHTKNLKQAENLLSSVHKSMKKGSYIFIREHNASTNEDIKYWQARHLLSINVSHVDPPCLTPDTVYKSMEEWDNILKKKGFKIITHETDRNGSNTKYSFDTLAQKI